MRVLAAVLITTWPCLAEPVSPLTNIANCAFTLGPAKCFSALTSWRAEKTLTNRDIQTNLTEDLKFPWMNYSNRSDEELHSQLCDETERLLRRKPLSLAVPGYRFEVLSRGNGSLNVDVYNTDVGLGTTYETLQAANSVSSRGLKKVKKKFLSILPLLIVPGLIMSAILPFVLPALKMMTMGAVLLNNMAFTGAVFTLLRNNAFNDKYVHKVIYVNEGYENEKHAHFNHFDEDHHEASHDYIVDEHGAPVEHLPQSDWVQKYHEPDFHGQISNGEFVQVSGGQYKRRRSSKIKTVGT